MMNSIPAISLFPISGREIGRGRTLLASSPRHEVLSENDSLWPTQIRKLDEDDQDQSVFRNPEPYGRSLTEFDRRPLPQLVRPGQTRIGEYRHDRAFLSSPLASFGF